MKSREDAARFVEGQFGIYSGYECPLEKGSQHHYGKQEVRDLLDFIYGGLPRFETEKVLSLNLKNRRPVK